MASHYTTYNCTHIEGSFENFIYLSQKFFPLDQNAKYVKSDSSDPANLTTNSVMVTF